LEFIHGVLKNRLSVEALVIGYDHRFGKNRTDSYDDYVRYGSSVGIATTKAEALHLNESSVSSSIIRKMIHEGDIEGANELLDYTYSLTGMVVEGRKLGRTIGFPTANICSLDTEKIIPSNGVYVVRVSIDNELIFGMLNIGIRPTIGANLERTIEVHLFNFDGDIYNHQVVVQFMHKLRDEQKMDGIEALKAQLSLDREEALQYFTKKG
jgi:riboflavin kinase/FMN adenylyltransferase